MSLLSYLVVLCGNLARPLELRHILEELRDFEGFGSSFRIDTRQESHAVTEVEPTFTRSIIMLSVISKCVKDLPHRALIVCQVVCIETCDESFTLHFNSLICTSVIRSSLFRFFNLREEFVKNFFNPYSRNLSIDHRFSSLLHPSSNSIECFGDCVNNHRILRLIEESGNLELKRRLTKSRRKCIHASHADRSVDDGDITIRTKVIVDQDEIMIKLIIEDFEGFVEFKATEDRTTTHVRICNDRRERLVFKKRFDRLERINVLSDDRRRSFNMTEKLSSIITIHCVVTLKRLINVGLHMMSGDRVIETKPRDDVFRRLCILDTLSDIISNRPGGTFDPQQRVSRHDSSFER